MSEVRAILARLLYARARAYLRAARVVRSVDEGLYLASILQARDARRRARFVRSGT